MKYFCYVIGVDVIEIILYVATDVNVYDVVFFGLIRVIFEMLDLMELLELLVMVAIIRLLMYFSFAGVVGVCGLSW